MRNSRSNYNYSRRSTMFPGTPVTAAADRTVQKRLGFIVSCLAESCTRILDVGCGSGVYLDALAGSSSQAVGIDIEYGHLHTRIEDTLKRNIELAQMDAANLAFIDGAFDAAVMIEVLEHVSNDTLVLQEVVRVLKRGGRLVITVPSKLFLFETHPIRVWGRLMGSPWGTGTPFLPLLPRIFRRHFATVRLYYAWELSKTLEEAGLVVHRLDFLMPSLDAVARSAPHAAARIVRWLRRLSDWLERSPLCVFGSTIAVRADKAT